MTYFGVLAAFIAPPLLALIVFVPRDVWRWLIRRQGRVNWKPYIIVLAHVGLALAYTTPWDNYLVATGVWWYDPDLVTGITLGYVPIEEYTFFVVQTLLTGLWTVWLVRGGQNIAAPDRLPGPAIRRWAFGAGGLLWLASTVLLLSGWQPGTYLALILSWVLVPVLVQLAFGADILLANWRRLAAAIILPTLYLWLADWFAIGSGTWTIDPQQTTGLMLGVLPVEEMVFFFMTNLLIGFGVTLMLSAESERRARALVERARALVARLRERLSGRAENPHASA